MIALGLQRLIYVKPSEARCGANLLLLPPYSPDFNPIENAYAKFKPNLRKAAARTIDALETAIADASRAFTPNECTNYFDAAGYRST
jgi:transposase